MDRGLTGLALRTGRQTFVFLLSVFAAGFLAFSLVRLAPGFGIDEYALDPRYAALPGIRQTPEPGRNVVLAYLDFIRRLAQGDLGESEIFGRPVTSLLNERAATTARNVAVGLAAGSLGGLTFALCGLFRLAFAIRLTASVVAAALLCVPSSLIAFGAVSLRLSASFGIAAVVFPRIYRHSDNLLRAGLLRAHVLSARARGIGEFRIVFHHVFRNVLGPLLALAGATVNLALSAAIPMEVLCDEAGLGQLAWRAALGRDSKLIVGITLIIAAVTLLSNRLAELAGGTLRGRSA